MVANASGEHVNTEKHRESPGLQGIQTSGAFSDFLIIISNQSRQDQMSAVSPNYRPELFLDFVKTTCKKCKQGVAGVFRQYLTIRRFVLHVPPCW